MKKSGRRCFVGRISVKNAALSMQTPTCYSEDIGVSVQVSVQVAGFNVGAATASH
jgi:hypothetical protein